MNAVVKRSACVLGLSVAMAGCGGGSSGWTSAEKVQYLASCHSLALRGLPDISHQVRVTYCEAALQNVEKYNPHHVNVHGFVITYPASRIPCAPGVKTCNPY
jgi:hypothetical protein